MAQSAREAQEERLVHRDASDLLHKHGIGALLVSAAASALLVGYAEGGWPRGGFLAWSIAMALIVGFRIVYLSYWHCAIAREHVRDGEREIRYFEAGVFITGLVWAAFPVFFFPILTQIDRSIMAVVLAGMVGGSTTVLSPSRRLVLAYNTLLLAPGSICFLASGGTENNILGVLGLSCYTVLSFSALIANRAVLQSIRLSRVNQQLLIDRESEHARIATANAELTSLQQALEGANQGLETKVADRTEKLLSEIRERKHYELELSRLASTDPLTGLCNRSSLAERVISALAESRASGSRAALLFVDLDDFKEVNDVRGHYAGDRVLSIVAERLTESIPPGSDLARWGGDEFVVVMRGLDSGEQAIEAASAVRDSICRPIDIGGEAVWVDATIGISIFPDHGSTHDALIRAADVAMYAAKQESHRRVRVFDPTLADQVAKAHFLSQCLSEAITNEKLSVAYQPIVSQAAGRCVALEALVRWDDPQRGAVPPSEFIPLAERSGDILALGRWVLEKACLEASRWPGVQPPGVSVNVSAAQVLAGSSFVEDVLGALERSGLPPDRLHLELTESSFAGDDDRVAVVLAKLRSQGVRISIDDFGTGFSSLAYLQNLPIDTIKIDKTFVSGIGAEAKPIVRAIVSMARALGYGLIAEGVETESQMSALNALGVEVQQGFLFSRPLPAADVPAWLQEFHHSRAATHYFVSAGTSP